MAKSPSRSRTRRRARTSRTVAASLPIGAALVSIRSSLLEAGAKFALIGGLAVSARAEPRLTRDIDIAIAAHDDVDSERLIAFLISRGFRLVTLIEQTRVERLATARFCPPSTDRVLIDLLFASSGIEREVVDAANEVELVFGLEMPVARAGHLVAMKLLSRGPKRARDNDDLQALLPMLDGVEKRRVVAAIKLIEKRGFARGRDLQRAWAALSKPKAPRLRRRARPPR